MTQNTTINIPAGTWTQLTDDNVTAVAVQNQSGYTIKLQATVGAVAPTGLAGAIDLLPGGIFTAQYLLSEVWPGVPGCNRVWAFTDAAGAVRVSHA